MKVREALQDVKVREQKIACAVPSSVNASFVVIYTSVPRGYTKQNLQKMEAGKCTDTLIRSSKNPHDGVHTKQMLVGSDKMGRLLTTDKENKRTV